MTLTKKRVLVFIDWYLPGYKAGGPTRSLANMVDHLHSEIDFYIVTRNNDYLQAEPYLDIEDDKWIKKFNANIFYLSEENLSASTIKYIIKNTNADLVYVNGIYSWFFSILPVWFSKHKKTIIATRGMLASSAIAIKSNKKTLFLKLAKLFGIYKNVTFHATNDSEKKEIELIFNENKIFVATNFPKKNILSDFKKKEKYKGELNLFSLARIAPEKNLKFALEVLKSCSQKINFDIYGSIYDSDYWSDCEKLIAEMPKNIVVRHKNEIEPDKVTSVISRYHFLFLPTLGENFGHSIFESFTAGVPVIISDQTPWKNLEKERCGFDLTLEDKIKFVETIDKAAMMDEQEYGELSNNAYLFASKFINDKQVREQNLQLFFN